MNASAAPVIVFGAFDRHNFGDLLFPHIVSALLPQRKIFFAGLAERDLREYGGHAVRRLPNLLKKWTDEPPVLIHSGGELLSCDAWEAAIMLQQPEQAQVVMRPYLDRPVQQQEWAHSYLGTSAFAPYMTGTDELPPGSRILYNAVGGVDLNSKHEAMRTEIVSKLAAANAIGVRDRLTLKQLREAGIKALLLPDPASLVRELFGAQISYRAEHGEVAAVRQFFAQGYLAMQFSADFGDDATLEVLEAQVRSIMKSTGCGVVLFRAGAAPWHDDKGVYQRLARKFSERELSVFESLDLWDICAMIASSHGYVGSSLHGRITAMAYALPRLNMVPGNADVVHASKQAAYAASWDGNAMPHVIPPEALHEGWMQAIRMPASTRISVARHCVQAYRSGFAELGRIIGF